MFTAKAVHLATLMKLSTQGDGTINLPSTILPWFHTSKFSLYSAACFTDETYGYTLDMSNRSAFLILFSYRRISVQKYNFYFPKFTKNILNICFRFSPFSQNFIKYLS